MKTLTTQEQKQIKDHFETIVDRQSREEMTAFLSGHFRYDTMSSWNRITSYAHCIKLHHGLGLPDDIEDAKYDMVFNDEWCEHMRHLIGLFDEDYDHNWQVGTNGRSGGYLVLYQGGIKKGKIVCCPGQSTDQSEDFNDWEMDKLVARVDLVCDFDMLATDIVIDFVSFCRTYDIVEQTIMVPKKVHVLIGKSQ